LPHAAAKATEAAAPEATEAATTASTRCMAGTPTSPTLISPLSSAARSIVRLSSEGAPELRLAARSCLRRLHQVNAKGHSINRLDELLPWNWQREPVIFAA
jgi:hypothetical protein